MGTFHTVIFADLTGSTGVFEALGNQKATLAVTRLTQLMAQACESHHGARGEDAGRRGAGGVRTGVRCDRGDGGSAARASRADCPVAPQACDADQGWHGQRQHRTGGRRLLRRSGQLGRAPVRHGRAQRDLGHRAGDRCSAPGLGRTGAGTGARRHPRHGRGARGVPDPLGRGRKHRSADLARRPWADPRRQKRL
jgi:hypothetical protein